MNEIHLALSQASNAAKRTEMIQHWLSSQPSLDLVTMLYKEWANKDKGVAKLLKEHLSQIKRAEQQAMAQQKWTALGERLLEQKRMPIADALAWQRDAAKEGAPLSQEPLSVIRDKLMERVRSIEDLQNIANIQKEAAILLAQRIELLAAKSLAEVGAAVPVLEEDVQAWQQKSQQLTNNPNWTCVDTRFVSAIEQAQDQLRLVWMAFSQAWQQTQSALQDPNQSLPEVPHWANQIRAQRHNQLEEEVQSLNEEEKAKRVALQNQLQAQRKEAQAAVAPILEALEQELAQGHGRATVEAAQKLRDIFKSTEAVLGSAMQAKVRTALAAAGELAGWQRWRADQLRQELIEKAQALLEKPLKPRQQQESLRQLREEWKRTDLGGVPNHGLWRKFDETCTQAYQPVQAWIDALKEQEAEQVRLRELLISEVESLASQVAQDTDYKKLYRLEGQYLKRWREGGHVSEKQYEILHKRFKMAMQQTFAPLHLAQQSSIESRKRLIEQASLLCSEEAFSVAAIKGLQEQWKQEAAHVVLDRRLEQKLWDRFKKPIDAAFARKDAARQQERNSQNEYENAVFSAVSALEQANQTGLASAIHEAMEQLDKAIKAQKTGADELSQPKAELDAQNAQSKEGGTVVVSDSDAHMDSSPQAISDNDSQASTQQPLVKAVVAVRGDDRPGAKPPLARQTEMVTQRLAVATGKKLGRNALQERGHSGRIAHRQYNQGASTKESASLPRLSASAQSAVRRAQEAAHKALRLLASQAHGQAIVALLETWRERDITKMPSASDLGQAVKGATYKLWLDALSGPVKNQDAQTALLRLELASEQPSPAHHQLARRSLQLQLLTQKHGPSPIESWPQDVAIVLACAHQDDWAQRLLAVLKRLLQTKP